MAAILCGIQDLRSGRTLVLHYYASRTERPFTFWTVVLVSRFAMGAVLLAAFAWHLAIGPAAQAQKSAHDELITVLRLVERLRFFELIADLAAH